jgi:hypothetical protein
LIVFVISFTSRNSLTFLQESFVKISQEYIRGKVLLIATHFDCSSQYAFDIQDLADWNSELPTFATNLLVSISTLLSNESF